LRRRQEIDAGALDKLKETDETSVLYSTTVFLKVHPRFILFEGISSFSQLYFFEAWAKIALMVVGTAETFFSATIST
jgi:hypothetical protein